MATDRGCTNRDVDRLGGSRNYIQVFDPCTCGMNTYYYGKTCQAMQINDSTRTIRGDSTPIRTWNRDQREFCNIGNQVAPPGVDTVTVDFYEMCEAGIPLPLTLDQCNWRAIVNHGLCRSAGNFKTSWSNYVEVYDLRTNSINLNRRTSYDGADDPRTISITATVENHFFIGPMNFSLVRFDPATICTTGNLILGRPHFSCNVGCGEIVCSCQQPCGDGTDTWYVPASCTGNTSAQYVLTFSQCGVQVKQSTLPGPITGQTAVERPIIVQCGSTVYALAYQNPVSLFRIETGPNGQLTGAWIKVGDLLDATVTAPAVNTTGTPASMVCEDGTLHILIREDTTGARYYTYNPSLNLTALTTRREFGTGANVRGMAACGDTIGVYGDGTGMEISRDNGATWNTLPVSSANPVMTGKTIADIAVNGDRIWVLMTDRTQYYTADFGETWKEVTGITGFTGTPNPNENVSYAWVGDQIGFVVAGNTLASTWSGGLTPGEWTTSDPRINGLAQGASGLNIRYLASPDCGPSWKQANTLLMVSDDGRNMWLGKTNQSGI